MYIHVCVYIYIKYIYICIYKYINKYIKYKNIYYILYIVICNKLGAHLQDAPGRVGAVVKIYIYIYVYDISFLK